MKFQESGAPHVGENRYTSLQSTDSMKNPVALVGVRPELLKTEKSAQWYSLSCIGNCHKYRCVSPQSIAIKFDA
jgi:hypothetical protein